MCNIKDKSQMYKGNNFGGLFLFPLPWTVAHHAISLIILKCCFMVFTESDTELINKCCTELNIPQSYCNLCFLFACTGNLWIQFEYLDSCYVETKMRSWVTWVGLKSCTATSAWTIQNKLQSSHWSFFFFNLLV